MASSKKSLIALVAFIVVGIALILAYGKGKPLGESPAIEFPSTPMSDSERIQFLTGDFKVIMDVTLLPEPVLKAFTEVGGTRPVMANPRQRFEAGDVITDPSVPRKRLVFAGVSRDKCVVHFEQGGRAHSYLVEFFQLSSKRMKPVWKAYCEPAKDMESLRLIITACRQ